MSTYFIQSRGLRPWIASLSGAAFDKAYVENSSSIAPAPSLLLSLPSADKGAHRGDALAIAYETCCHEAKCAAGNDDVITPMGPFTVQDHAIELRCRTPAAGY